MITRAERRSEAAKRRARIDPSCPAELVRAVDVKLATLLAGKALRFNPGDDVASVFTREFPELFALTEAEGFSLSFKLPETSREALARGVVGYTIKRRTLN